MSMRLVARNGQVLAILGATRFYLAPELEDRQADDPLRRMVSALCAHMLDVDSQRQRRDWARRR
jgi:hypothetical protein